MVAISLYRNSHEERFREANSSKSLGAACCPFVFHEKMVSRPTAPAVLPSISCRRKSPFGRLAESPKGVFGRPSDPPQAFNEATIVGKSTLPRFDALAGADLIAIL